MKPSVSALLTLAVCLTCARGEELPTIRTNFEYRQAWGDLGTPGEITAAPTGSRRALRLSEGGDQLLEVCRRDPKHWKEDPLIFRLAHKHAGSTIGCREKASPSAHLVFYETPEGGREAWVHFDLYGPQNPLMHLTEVFRNRMSFGRTDSNEVYRGLRRTFGDSVPVPRYDVRLHTRQYLHRILSPNAVLMGVASGSGTLGLRDMLGFGKPQTYVDRVSTNLLRNTIAQSIEFGTAAFLQQDQEFHGSGEHGFGRRVRSALYRSVFVPGRDGEELAFPRVAAALGTPWAMRHWHPGQPAPPNPWVQSAFLFSRYVARSFWAEFKPEVQHALRKLRPGR